MEKPIKEWLETIEDKGIRANALVNYDPNFHGGTVDNLGTAIALAFSWGLTPQGISYWADASVEAKSSDRSLDNSTLEERLATAEAEIKEVRKHLIEWSDSHPAILSNKFFNSFLQKQS